MRIRYVNLHTKSVCKLHSNSHVNLNAGFQSSELTHDSVARLDHFRRQLISLFTKLVVVSGHEFATVQCSIVMTLLFNIFATTKACIGIHASKLWLSSSLTTGHYNVA